MLNDNKRIFKVCELFETLAIAILTNYVYIIIMYSKYECIFLGLLF